MSHRRLRLPALLIALVLVPALLAAPRAEAAYYKMVACSGSNGIPSPGLSINTNTRSATYPEGIFHLWNFCDGEGGDPPGDGSLIRIQEHKPNGQKGGYTAYGHLYMRSPSGVHFKTVGVYTRQPDSFNSGWRARVWIGSCCATAQIFSVGKGLANVGGQGSPTSGFVGRPWPLEVFYDFDTVVFEMTCANTNGCSTDGTNTADFNGLDFIMEDEQNAKVVFTDKGNDFLAGKWVKGRHVATFDSSDVGTGVRRDSAKIDGAEHWSYLRPCSTSSSARSGEWARKYQPCDGGPHHRTVGVETADLSDGSHALQACSQDFAQYQGLYRSGSESCATRTVRTDNTAPGKPAGLEVTSANPERYLARFGAKWSLPPNSGSPIKKVHYEVIDASGEAVIPERTLDATNPTELAEFDGPSEPGAYRMRVWLEDEVRFLGPAAIAKVPHDTTPPAPPQRLSAASPDTPRSAQGFDVRWGNVVDAGSPIVAAHYQVRDGSGRVVVGTETERGNDIRSIASIETPREAGRYSLRLWLTDAEGNTGEAASVPLAYECVRSSRTEGSWLSATLDGNPAKTVAQGEAATLRGELRSKVAGIQGAPLCVFSQVEGSAEREFLGIAITGTGGSYRFVVGPGPSRHLSAVYRPDQRQLRAGATLRTQVKPTLKARKQVVRTGEAAQLYGQIPGPRNDEVTVVIQVRQGDGWLAFRRYRTRDGGRFEAHYPFRRTTRPTTYEFRAQVRESGGYPYVEGDSDSIYLRVLPKKTKAAGRRCPKGKRRAKARAGGKAKARCVRARPDIHRRCARARRAARRRPGVKSMRRRAHRLCARSKQVRRGERRGHPGGKGRTHRQGRR